MELHEEEKHAVFFEVMVEGELKTETLSPNLQS